MHSELIARAFTQALDEFNGSGAVRRILSGDFGKAHYASILKEIFHYAKEDPQLQALAAVYFRGDDRGLVKMFFQHATSEIGHDRMALEDVEALGEDASDVALSNPLPETIALTAFPFYQIQFRHPIGYLGYLYFLEHMPTAMGDAYATALLKAGIPRDALRFLGEHAAVDVAHNKLMERYLDALLRTERDAAETAYAIRVTGRLYGSMLGAAIDRADTNESFGVNWSERERTAAAVVSSNG